MLIRVKASVMCVVAAPMAAAAAPPPDKATERRDPNEIVCEKIEQTGSRLAVRRVCMTRSQWAERRLQDREQTERTQTQKQIVQ